MKKLFLSGLLTINFLFLFAQSSNRISNPINNNSTTGNSFTHYVGELYGGGVVFDVYKDETGHEHGLIVALNDQATEQAWSNVTSVSIGNSTQNEWDGLQNSRSIIRQQNHTSSAAKICFDLCDGGFHDWYLPALNEMEILYTVKMKVNRTLHRTSGATQLISRDNYYWTSTEVNSESVFYANFTTILSGNVWGLSEKYFQFAVRAIRAF